MKGENKILPSPVRCKSRDWGSINRYHPMLESSMEGIVEKWGFSYETTDWSGGFARKIESRRGTKENTSSGGSAVGCFLVISSRKHSNEETFERGKHKGQAAQEAFNRRGVIRNARARHAWSRGGGAVHVVFTIDGASLLGLD